MSGRVRSEAVLFLLALIVVHGLAAVQTMRYLEDFVTWSQPPAVMYGSALVVGALLGWVFLGARAVLLSPLAVAMGAAAVFFVVAWSPVWLGGSRHDIAVVNELLRQATLVVLLTLVPMYMGAIGGYFVRQVRE
jgi:hypothetical protein